MDTIVAKLSEIEAAAVSIIMNTDVQKKEYEQKIAETKQAFDAELSDKTAKTIHSIKADSKVKLEKELETLKTNHELALNAFENEYEQHHESYAAQIIKRITEV